MEVKTSRGKNLDFTFDYELSFNLKPNGFYALPTEARFKWVPSLRGPSPKAASDCIFPKKNSVKANPK